METEKIDVPKFEGFECIGFVPPRDHLPCSYIDGNSSLIEASDVNRVYRICYRKIKPKRITFERVGEWTPKKGEYFMNKNGYLDMCTCSFAGDHAHEIYRVVEDQS